MSNNQTNTEKYFAEKLGNRTLEPSAKAWKKVQQQIQTPKKEKYKWRFYVPVAAALAVLGLFYFQNISGGDYKPTNDSYKKPIPQVLIQDDSLWQAKPTENKKTSTTILTTIDKPTKEAKNIDKKTEITTTEVTENQPIKATEIADLLIENSFAENSTIIQKKSFPKLKIDSKTLLNETETEVTKGFREKVIEKIATNYEVLKEAYANRNYEKPND